MKGEIATLNADMSLMEEMQQKTKEVEVVKEV